MQYNTIKSDNSRAGYLSFLGFPTPEQGDKFKMPVTHTHLIKVEFPPRIRIVFISGSIWYQTANLIPTGSTWPRVNTRLIRTISYLFQMDPVSCKHCLKLSFFATNFHLKSLMSEKQGRKGIKALFKAYPELDV